MRILLIHTFYQRKGGEDVVFSLERDMLKKENEVLDVTFVNRSGLKGFIQFLFSIWNFAAYRRVTKAIKVFNPDVIHIHNVHYACGPVVIRCARSHKIPVVMTLHNYRLICPSGILLHNGKTFTDSINATFPWKAVTNRVFRNSFLQTFWLAFTNWFHRSIGTWKLVDKYIVLTPFAKDLFNRSTLNLSQARFVVKPNFVLDKKYAVRKRGSHFLFVGRLGEEKGLRDLISVINNSLYELRIAGDGPLKYEILKVCSINCKIKYLGLLDSAQVQNEMLECSALVFPSTWFEGMPLTLIESFSFQTATIVSNLGAMADMVEDEVNGLLFEAGNADSLRAQLDKWNSFPEKKRDEIHANARLRFEERYNEHINYTNLLNIYESVVPSYINPAEIKFAK